MLDKSPISMLKDKESIRIITLAMFIKENGPKVCPMEQGDKLMPTETPTKAN